MDNAKNMHDEEEFHWTKGLIFTAIVLFPLIPFVLIYRHKFTRKTKIILMMDYFIFLTAIYQIACVTQGASIHSVAIADRYVTMRQGETYQIHYTTSPQKDKLTITNVNYHSSNRSVASVNSQGLVTCLSDGNATVTVSVTDNHYTTKEKTLHFVIVE